MTNHWPLLWDLTVGVALLGVFYIRVDSMFKHDLIAL
jgi:hypothetical protein